MKATTIRHWLSASRRRGAWIALVAILAMLHGSPSHAGWREEMKTFRVGMIAEEGAGQTVPGLSVLKRAYSQALGIPVEIFVARDYASLIDAQATSRVDYAIYSTTAYATASLLCSCVEPVAAPIGADGATGIVAVLITRDDRLPDLAEIARHRIAVAPADSIAASALPLSGLAVGATPLTGAEPYLVHAESASAAEAMLVDGSVDAVFGWMPAGGNAGEGLGGGTLDRLAAAGPDRSSLKIVWKSPLLRYGPHALRSGLDSDGDLGRTLIAFLTGLKDLYPDVYDLLETDRGGGFVKVKPEDYAPAIDLVRSIAGQGTSR